MFFLLGIAIVLYGRRDWMPPLASRHGAGIDAMLAYLLVTTGTLLLMSFTALAWLLWRGGPRQRVTQRLASRRTELLVSGGVGLLMAAIAEGGVLAIGLPVWRELFLLEPPAEALTIEVTAQQFFWTVRYPGPDQTFGRTATALVDDGTNPLGADATDPGSRDDITLTNRIIVELNRPVHLRLRAKDVIHSFFLPHFRVKQDVIPGMTPTVTFTPTREGTFELACAELCGLGHYRMQGYIVVVPAADFDRALQQEIAP